eukprot:gb/GECG01005124.1/.p1 GENE.gb/GECG01005124.1/~~gb/GECG01005124.1/.p1  ORF type:complete len:145 (+),score=11.56 gb/GECG01005124.1/:1-435(+)
MITVFSGIQYAHVQCSASDQTKLIVEEFKPCVGLCYSSSRSLLLLQDDTTNSHGLVSLLDDGGGRSEMNFIAQQLVLEAIDPPFHHLEKNREKEEFSVCFDTATETEICISHSKFHRNYESVGCRHLKSLRLHQKSFGFGITLC